MSKCKFCECPTHARGLCGLHYSYARRLLKGFTPDDFEPSKRLGVQTPSVTSVEALKLFGEEFNKLRKDNNYTIASLSRNTGINRSTIRRMECDYGSISVRYLLAALGSTSFGPELLRRLADRLEGLHVKDL